MGLVNLVPSGSILWRDSTVPLVTRVDHRQHWSPVTGQNRWKGSPNDSEFLEFLDQYENCLLSYQQTEYRQQSESVRPTKLNTRSLLHWPPEIKIVRNWRVFTGIRGNRACPSSDVPPPDKDVNILGGLIPRSGVTSNDLNRVSNLILQGVWDTFPRFFFWTKLLEKCYISS